jgi:hypothetical protein
MDEKELYSYWKKYVDSKFLYRVVSEEYVPSIKKQGFNHNKDPFEKNKNDIYKLFSICMRLYKQGFIMMRWWGKPVDQKKVIKISKEDLANPGIDFTPNFENILFYYLNLQGGALVCTVRIFTEELIMKRPPLSDSEWTLVKKLNVWSRKKYSYRNKVVVIRASSKCFEHAHFQWFRVNIQKYLPG